VLKIYLNYLEFLQKVLAKHTVNLLPESVGNIWKIIHGQELIIRPHCLANFDRSFGF